MYKNGKVDSLYTRERAKSMHSLKISSYKSWRSTHARKIILGILEIFKIYKNSQVDSLYVPTLPKIRILLKIFS